MRLSPAMEQAVRALAKRGGAGAIDRFGFVIAGGEKLKFSPATWLRLVAGGLLTGDGSGRLNLSEHALQRVSEGDARNGQGALHREQHDGAENVGTDG